jgi:hypothetical protein
MTDFKRLDPVEAGARALARALACARCGRQYDATFATEHADHCGACAAIMARAALAAVAVALEPWQLEYLAHDMGAPKADREHHELYRAALLRALTGQEKD